MGKKTANPADAFRKAQRKKELKKNKTERAKARDFALVKKDTTVLEDEILELEEEAATSGKGNPRIAELKAELEKINEKKAEYVEEHPEARRLVYKARRKEGDRNEEEKPVPASRNMFNRKGLPRHPERSIYYDPVMNPFGVPPPGMPYMERPLLPGEVDSDAEPEDGDEDDDIPLPPGPPPGSEEVASDDEIPLPEGPPPGAQEASDSTFLPPLPPGPPPPHSFFNLNNIGSAPPPPPGFPPQSLSGLPPPPPGMPPSGVQVFPGFPPPPPGFPFQSLSGVPPPLPGMPPGGGFPLNMIGMVPPPPGMPPPPPGFPANLSGLPPPPPGHPPNFVPNFPPPGAPFHGLPPPPPGFLPHKNRNQTLASLQDPLSTIPHQTYQAHRASQATTTPHPSLPPKPVAASVKANATVEAAPELRDFKKEATAFVPTALKRKKPGAAKQTPAINAAPSIGDSGPGNGSGSNVESGPARPDLVSALKNQFPMPAPKAESKPKDDYAKFVEEMDDILG